MFYPWRTLFVAATWALLSTGILAVRAAENEIGSLSKERAAGATSSIIIGVVLCLLLVSLAGLAIYYFFRQMRGQSTDIESAAATQKPNWWMVDSKNEKGGVMEWWRQSHSIPDRIEPPSSAAPQRSSLQRLRSALTRKGALKGLMKKNSSEGELPLYSKSTEKTSPTITIDLPLQAVPTIQPRYPSVLERGYRVPLYPVHSPPKAPSATRSLTTPVPAPVAKLPAIPVAAPQPPQPRAIVAERALRRQLAPIPAPLNLNGRTVISIPKIGSPRSPAHRRRGLLKNFKHPFLPLKDSDTAFPTISSPMPCTETALTNPKLGYSCNNSRSRAVPTIPAGPRRLSRTVSRRVPVPTLEVRPPRPLLPALPLHLKEGVHVYPPGSPSIRRETTPVPI